ncbi:MAG: YigZ family protein [Clostridia bacterium]|nr:YigZ family protein [Clostridia bacterium]
MTEYITVLENCSAEYFEKRSRFIANVYHCESEEDATRIISETRSKFFDAKHNVYAYLLKDKTARFSDDGEPHGTAGKPILDIINGSGVTDILIVVTRYFGGVLLGTGGLVRAYSSASRDALLSAQKVKMCLGAKYSVKCEYTDHSRLLSVIENCNGTVNDTVFADNVEVFFSLKKEDIKNFEDTLCESFSARLVANFAEECIFSIKI